MSKPIDFSPQADIVNNFMGELQRLEGLNSMTEQQAAWLWVSMGAALSFRMLSLVNPEQAKAIWAHVVDDAARQHIRYRDALIKMPEVH